LYFNHLILYFMEAHSRYFIWNLSGSSILNGHGKNSEENVKRSSRWKKYSWLNFRRSNFMYQNSQSFLYRVFWREKIQGSQCQYLHSWQKIILPSRLYFSVLVIHHECYQWYDHLLWSNSSFGWWNYSWINHILLALYDILDFQLHHYWLCYWQCL